MNKIMLCGRITAEPDVRTSSSGFPVVKFSLAVPRNRKKDGETETDFFNVAALGKTAEAMAGLHIAKGTKIIVEGEMQNNNYVNSNGEKRYGNQVVLHHFEFCEPKRKTETQESDADAEGTQGFTEIEDGELPFD